MKTLTIIFALATVIFTPALGAQVGMKWECFSLSDSFGTDRPIVTASVDAMEWNYGSSGKWKTGVIEANGIVKDAQYSQKGLTHAWHFDFAEDDGRSESAFDIDPSNYGRYYDFTANYTTDPESGGRETKSSFSTKCKRTK
ncbi:MAG: hypothetical protein OXU31_08680 [Gammaproteobacteria bacterium]|nr:hypothetical protein [Gammaproteobacteria bacterium]MDD9850251.1 hypothetical protein [Gammaproteobacteria bacterium]